MGLVPVMMEERRLSTGRCCDDETDEFIPNLIKAYGIQNPADCLTDFDAIEIDEGRWHPDQWRQAWK